MSGLMEYKKWMDENLITCLMNAEKSGDQEIVETILFWLAHINIVDEIFRAHLTKTKHVYSKTVVDKLPSATELITSVRNTDNWLINYETNLSEHDRQAVFDFTYTDGEPGQLTAQGILTHLLSHGLYHISVVDDRISKRGYDVNGILFTTHMKHRKQLGPVRS